MASSEDTGSDGSHEISSSGGAPGSNSADVVRPIADDEGRFSNSDGTGGAPASTGYNGSFGGYSTIQDPDGLRAYYRFDETSGALAVDSVSSVIGRIVLAQRVDGEQGNALSFGQTGARVELPPLGPMTQLSFELWLFPKTLDANSTAHVLGDSGNGVQSFRLELHGDKLVFLASADGSAVVPLVTSHASLEVGRWQLVTVTFDSNSANLYLDGVEDSSESALLGLSPPLNTLYVGARATPEYSYVNQFYGAIDELKIWNRALSAEEVARHMPSP